MITIHPLERFYLADGYNNQMTTSFMQNHARSGYEWLNIILVQLAIMCCQYLRMYVYRHVHIHNIYGFFTQCYVHLQHGNFKASIQTIIAKYKLYNASLCVLDSNLLQSNLLYKSSQWLMCNFINFMYDNNTPIRVVMSS